MTGTLCQLAMTGTVKPAGYGAFDAIGKRFRVLPIFILSLSFIICSLPCVSFGDSDPVDDILGTKPKDRPEALKYVSDLIKTHGTHPRILELRYYRTGQLMGGSSRPTSTL